MDYTKKTDEQLATMAEQIAAEQARRVEIASIPSVIADLIEQWETLVPDHPDGWRSLDAQELAQLIAPPPPTLGQEAKP